MTLLVMVEERICSICHELKSLDRFQKDSKGKFGHRSNCKECSKVKEREKNYRRREQRKIYSADYYQKNSEKIKAYVKDWRGSNPDKCKKYHQDYALANTESEKLRSKSKHKRLFAEDPEKFRAAARSWAKRNPDLVRAKAQRRRARKKSTGVFVILSKELKRLYSKPCNYCGETGSTVADHVIPLVRGGRHSIGNLQPLCFMCNSVKQARLQIEWKFEMIKNHTYDPVLDEFISPVVEP